LEGARQSLGTAFTRFAEAPLVYEAVYTLSGGPLSDRRFAHAIATVSPGGAHVLDMGGGTGRASRLLPLDAHYVCLDNDVAKLRFFRRRYPSRLVMRSDVTRAAFKPECFDVVLCQAVSHHLPDDVVANLFSESARVLRPDGRLVFLDATKTERTTGRFLWRLDQGSSPRSEQHLRALLESFFEVDCWERFAMLHDYVLVVARPRSSVRPASAAAAASPAAAICPRRPR